MNAGHCCRKSEGDSRHLSSFARHCLDKSGWLLPTAILTLFPKCPACLALYIALGTGVGLSVTAATYLRIALLLTCVGSLLYLAAKHLRIRRNVQAFTGAISWCLIATRDLIRQK